MSLLYAGRAKKIKNRAVKNRELHAAGSAAAAAAGKSVRQLEAIEHLRRQLAARTAEFERLKAATRAADGTAHENDALRARLRSLGEQNEREKAQLETCLRSVIHGQAASLRAQQDRYSSLQAELEGYRATCGAQEAEIERLRRSVAQLAEVPRPVRDSPALQQNTFFSDL